MKVLVCIDDTDNLESRGTGKLAASLASEIETNGCGKTGFVTRHQLFVHPDIPYTSHNSSMCFSADIQERYLDSLIDHASRFLENESAQGSDPGLCIAPADAKDLKQILDFGLRAKQCVLAKGEAYALAGRHEIHLSEHGGTGHGVIGALAGVGLRLGGNDGRLRGRLEIAGPNDTISVRSILSRTHVAAVRSLCGQTLKDDDLVRLEDKVKAVYRDARPILLVSPIDADVDGVRWRTCSKQELRKY